MSNPGVRISRWFSSEPGRITLLALLYVFFGRLLLALDAEPSIQTPIFFIPEGIALAFVLLYGRTMAIGVFAGQLLLSLGAGAPAWQAIGLGCSYGLEALIASLLTQWLRLDLRLNNQKDFWILLGLIALIFQPFSATVGLLILSKFPSQSASIGGSMQLPWINWWLSGAMSQSQLTPFLLFFLPKPRSLFTRPNLIWAAKVMPLLTAILLINFYGGLNTTTTALGFFPLLMITPLTISIALQTNNFALFSLYSSMLALGISILLQIQSDNLLLEPEDIARTEIRVMVVCWISQAVNLATIQLITARDLANQRSKQLAQQLKISLMAASLTHEVKQPIAAIRLAGQQLLTTPEANRSQLINAVMQSADELSVSTAKVHNLLRSIPAGLQPLDLSSCVELAVLQEKFKLEEAQVYLRTRGLERPFPIKGDSSQISLALSNLLRNCIQELRNLPVDQPRLLTVELATSPSWVALSIGDNGRGFPSDDWQPNLFKTSKPDGTGLGLYLVQQMAENHQAQLLFGRSSMGGALVTIRFPL
jgi:signal transduction histidine kinase